MTVTYADANDLSIERACRVARAARLFRKRTWRGTTWLEHCGVTTKTRLPTNVVMCRNLLARACVLGRARSCLVTHLTGSTRVLNRILVFFTARSQYQVPAEQVPVVVHIDHSPQHCPGDAEVLPPPATGGDVVPPPDP